MKEKDSSDEENQNGENSPKNSQQIENNILNEEEKSNSEEEKSNIERENSNIERENSNPLNSFLNIVNQVKKNKNNENIKNKEDDEDTEEDRTFEENLLLECQREDEENLKKIKEKELQKKIKRVKSYNFKDYFLLFIFFMAFSLNFNYLSIIYVAIGLVYLVLAENLNQKSKKIKYLLEIFTIGYASYTLLFKIVIIILAVENNDSVINNKDFYIDLGIIYLHDKKSTYYLFLSFCPDIIMILSSGYGIYISFKCRTLVNEDINFRKMKKITIRNLILISYIFIILFAVFNISYLTLFYIVLIQFCLLLSSLKVKEETIKKIFKFIIFLILLLISIQFFLINVFNIQNLQEKYLRKNVKIDEDIIKIYSLLTEIGINYEYRYYEEKWQEYLKKIAGYFFGVLSMSTLAFIYGEINKGPDILSEEELKVNKMKEKIERHKEINKNNYLLNGIDELIRVICIVWIYFFRNFFSLGIFIVIFFSFYFIDRNKNKFLILYLLLPMLFLTLIFIHISNIDGLFENLKEDKAMKLKRFSIEKYEYIYIQYLCGHLFYILLMFLISSLYYYEKVKQIIKNKESILSKKNSQQNGNENEKIENIENKENNIENENNKNEEAILPTNHAGSTKSVDIAFSTPKNNFGNDLLYEDVEDSNIISDKMEDSSSDSGDSNLNEEKRDEIKEKESKDGKVDEFNFKFKELLAKYFFINIDKVTLVVMYLVSVHTVNLVHLILVVIFIMQILLPKKMHYFYKLIISIFQLLYLVEFIIDLLKIYYYDKFNDKKDILKYFIVYTEDKKTNDVEIFIFAVIYCFCFQYRAYRNKYIASLLENKKISFRNYLKNTFSKKNDKDKEKNELKIKINDNKGKNILYNTVCIINDITEHAYLWFLVIAFIFFSCFFEMNIIFWVKLIFFFISLYYYIISIQAPNKYRDVDNKKGNINITLYRIINKVIIVYCGLNTFVVFLYQFLKKESFDFQTYIDEKKNGFFLNLSIIGFTMYKEENLYYNFLPYFMTCFIFMLYKRKTKKILKKINNYLIIRKQTNNKNLLLLKEKHKREEEKMKKIKEEQNEFIQDKLYADKYNENEKEIFTKSSQLLKANVILIITKCYWLFLFLFVGIIYSYYEISLSILIYIIIFGFYFIKMFHRIISKLRNYIKMKSYYISKVVRFSLIEDPKHYLINRRYRIILFRVVLIYSFLYLILLYFYGLFDLLQHGCDERIFKGCRKTHSSLVKEDGAIETFIKSFAFLLGIYINTHEKKINDIWWNHFLVTCILISDIYFQKLEEYYHKRYDELRIDLQKMVNENNVLEKYSRIIDYNILIKIGLTVAGIDLTPVKDKNNKTDFRLSLQKKFLRNPKELSKLITHKDNNDDEQFNNLKTIMEDLSRPSSSDDIESDLNSKSSKSSKKRTKSINIEENIVDEFDNLNLDENSPGNEFLKNNVIKQFLKIFSICNDNKQTLSVGNSKDRVMRFLKKFFEELIIFLLICISLGKLNIWTFVYLIFTFYLIATEKTMWKYFILSCFIYVTIIIQSLFFLSNLSSNITNRDYDNILESIKIKIGFPWYQNVLNEKIGFFLGVGVSKSQVNLLWLEFMQIVVIFFYLDMFSYSIYQDILNLGQTTMNKDKFNFESLNLKPSTIDSIKQMSEIQFQQYNECLKCFDMNIGKDHNEFLKILKIKESGLSRISDISENRRNKKKYNLEDLKNPTLKELIYFRLVNKENNNSNTGTYKPLPKYLVILQEFLYMYFHCVVLILIIFLSILIGRLISILYVTLSLYYLINCELLYLGERYTYFKTIKTVLRTVILIDILIQGIYQTPFVSPDEKDLSFKIFDSLGFIQVINFEKGEGDSKIEIDQSIQVFSKAIIYLLISLQILIYESNHFKTYYLVFLLENKNEFKRHSIINSFKFNNQRVKIFKKSLNIRQRSDQAMEDLKRVIEELNDKLKEIGGKLIDDIKKKKTLTFDESSTNIKNDIDENQKNKNITDKFSKFKENNLINAGKNEGILGFIKKTSEMVKENNYIEVDEVKEKIKNMLYNSLITKLYLFLHKYSASYRSIEEEEKDDFDIETIKGETKIKSIIENDVNRLLNITDLEHFDKEDLKSIELLFEAHFDENKRILLEEKKLKDEKSKKVRRRFSNLYNLHKFIKADTKNTEKKNEDADILGFFKEKVKKEKEERAHFEQEEKIKEFRERYKFQQFEELLETNLFKKYLTKTYLIENLFYLTFSFFVHNFDTICYMVMILNHIMSASVASLFYPLSIFCFALIEYPRPKKVYWMICLYYTVFLVLIKFVLQQKIITIIVDEESYKDIIDYLYYYKIGFKYHSSLFTGEFIRYIIFDVLTLLTILIYRNLLITDGIWYKREQEIENIYEASERIAIYQTKTYENKIDAIKDLLLQYLYTPKEILNLTMAERNRYADNEEDFKNSYINVKHKFPFILKRNTDPAYNEVKRGYFSRIFTRNRNEKPGAEFYSSYTLVMFLICLYILVFYTQMVQDNTYDKINLDTTQFSGSMVLYLILHIAIIIIDRIIFVSQNRDNLQYEYIFYKRNENNQQGELLTEVEENELKSEISKNNKSKYKITNLPRQEIEKQLKKYNIVFIQKETFNTPLFIKYIIHIFTVIFNHIIIFFYFPIKGNKNLGAGVFCTDDQCNDFHKNYLIWIFYLIYLIYIILSSLQIKYGFYDIKRKSLFKKGQDELFSNMASLFKNIPFLYEIKNAIDWTFTHTCLDLFQWNKFEAIYDSIFDTYCEKGEWDEKPIGDRVSKKKKCGMGFTLSFALIFILIIPLLLFSSLNPTNKINNIIDASMSIDLTFNYKNGVMKNYNLFLNERADSISEMFKSSENKNKEDSTIWDRYKYSKSIETRNFKHDQVQRIIFSETSDRNWELAYPHIINLIELLDTNKTSTDISSIEININYELDRPLPAEAQSLKKTFTVPIFIFGDKSEENLKGAEQINNFREALRRCDEANITLNNAYSPPLRLTSGTEISIIEDDDFEKKNVTMSFLGCSNDNGKISYFNSYFTFRVLNRDSTTEPIEFHIFNDKISETTQGYSVITFYITFVLLVGSYVRDFLSSDPETITLDEMPHPKKIVDLCEGIKIARYGYDFRNEEYLYTILIELMRSPDYLKLLTDSSLDHFKSREKLTKDDD